MPQNAGKCYVALGVYHKMVVYHLKVYELKVYEPKVCEPEGIRTKVYEPRYTNQGIRIKNTFNSNLGSRVSLSGTWSTHKH